MQPDWDWQRPPDDEGELAALLCFNVIHIAPWAVAQNLMRGAGRHLVPERQERPAVRRSVQDGHVAGQFLQRLVRVGGVER